MEERIRQGQGPWIFRRWHSTSLRAVVAGKHASSVEKPGRVFASWYSGTLVVPDDEMLHYVHMGFGSVYERELHITVANGVVTHTEVVDNRARLEASRPS